MLKELIKTQKKPQKDYLNNYGYIPMWVLVKVLSFGVVVELFSVLKKEDQYDIVVWCDCKIGSFETGANVRKKPNKNGAVKWLMDEEKNEIALPAINHMFFPKDYAQVPDIFINLYTGRGNQSDNRRIGYIRLKAEQVNQWSSTAEPRWLHFKPLDTTMDSPGSILVNLQFLPSNESMKRVFKEPGIDKKYTLLTHIVNGFELCPKLKEKDEDKNKIESENENLEMEEGLQALHDYYVKYGMGDDFENDVMNVLKPNATDRFNEWLESLDESCKLHEGEKILSSISVIDGYISFLDTKLKSALISSRK